LQEFAIRWAYLIRNRTHWNKTKWAAMRSQLQRQVKSVGFRQADFRKLGECQLIEVEIPFRREEEGWEARVLPWEFVLTNLAEGRSDGLPPIVVRRLKVRGRRRVSQPPAAAKLAYVQSAPGALAAEYDFSKEKKLVVNSLRHTHWLQKTLEVIDPTLEELRSALQEFCPTVVHFTGVDNHQGAELLAEAHTPLLDGVYLKCEAPPGCVPIEAKVFAPAIAGESCRPALVGLNMYHSAPRIAPLAIAAGAGAVVAFQDAVDDTLAELFFADFYRAWSKSQDLLAAFRGTLHNLMRSSGQTLAGTGVVLWSAASLLLPTTAPPPDEENYSVPARLAELDPQQPLEQQIQVDVKVRDNINYSLLHNGRSLFQQLYVVNRTGKRLDNLQVRVRLFVAGDTDEQVTRLNVAGPGVDVGRLVSVPLISRQLRCYRESVLTSLKVTVEWEGRVIKDENHTVRVLPLNEWCEYEGESQEPQGQWLPSFVQPLDPAVSQILSKAERHLRTITGDPYAGFDGYQQVDGRREFKVVDQQVEAIWAALLHDYSIAYVNPPPVYTPGSQRIRSPSEVVEQGRGTCLDLTVLVASCLEHVEIYPAVVLLTGHAFPAYWRSPALHEEFWGGGQAAIEERIDVDVDHAAVSARGRLDDQRGDYLWMTRPSGYSRLTKAVARGHLVPLESVWLTARESFDEACEAGGENLIDRSEFECLLDVRRAREENVLPLPERT
ncbi:MAG TPA: CHAT domain-containing protein, partial [Pirellulaceae bacterium]|nr:CHAT domain-containing protein [Pirellulaceae bacterium]